MVPILFVLSPQLLLIGDAWSITLATITAVAGVWLVSIAIAGYFVRRLGSAARLGFAAAGLLALIPAGAFPGAVYTDVVGTAVGAGLIAREVLAAAAQGRRRIARCAERTDEPVISGIHTP